MWHFVPGRNQSAVPVAAAQPAAPGTAKSAAPPPVDNSTPAPPGGKIEVAFVDSGAIDVSEELCRKKKAPREWIKEGATVWLYGPDRLGKATV